MLCRALPPHTLAAVLNRRRQLLPLLFWLCASHFSSLLCSWQLQQLLTPLHKHARRESTALEHNTCKGISMGRMQTCSGWPAVVISASSCVVLTPQQTSAAIHSVFVYGAHRLISQPSREASSPGHFGIPCLACSPNSSRSSNSSNRPRQSVGAWPHTYGSAKTLQVHMS